MHKTQTSIQKTRRTLRISARYGMATIALSFLALILEPFYPSASHILLTLAILAALVAFVGYEKARPYVEHLARMEEYKKTHATK